jgi:hypothetical protein
MPVLKVGKISALVAASNYIVTGVPNIVAENFRHMVLMSCAWLHGSPWIVNLSISSSPKLVEWFEAEYTSMYGNCSDILQDDPGTGCRAVLRW